MELTWQRRSLRLHHPFNIARLSASPTTHKEVLLVCIEHDGQTGWGEPAPVSYYHQSLDSAESTLSEAGPLLGNDPLAIDEILGRLWERFADQPATIAAIDGALHDLIGKLTGEPTWKRLGLDPRRIPLTSFTIGIDDLEVVADKVREAADYPVLKIKVGTADDEAVLETIRREAPNKTLRVDANCGWSSANVDERCRLMEAHDVELIEQPTPTDVVAVLGPLRDELRVPLIADESCVGPDDVLACADHFDGINIKLSKCGGIRRALQMIDLARSANLKIMLGCMVETSVGIAPAVQIAPLVDYVDLDGHLLLADDPFDGIGGQAGKLTLTERPGLGVSERHD